MMCSREVSWSKVEKGSLDVSLIFFMTVWIPPLYTPNWMLHKGSTWAGHPDTSVGSDASVWLSWHQWWPHKTRKSPANPQKSGMGAGPLLFWDGRQVPHRPGGLPQASLLPFNSAAELNEGSKAVWGWWMILLGVLFGFFLEANPVNPVKCQPPILIAHKRQTTWLTPIRVSFTLFPVKS